MYALAGQLMPSTSVRGGTPRLEEDLTDRKFGYVVKNIDDTRREVKELESKKVFKKRHEGRSPDDGDGYVLAVAPEYVFHAEDTAPNATAVRAAFRGGARRRD